MGASKLFTEGVEALFKSLSGGDEVADAIRAYHGSPYDFEKFDLSKIGTGEGAQAYGHGLYFADSEGVARSYRDAVSKQRNPTASINDLIHQMVRNSPESRNIENVKFYMKQDPVLNDYTNSPEIVRDIHAALTGQDVGGSVSEDAIGAYSRLTDKFGRNPKGKMYEVDINANPEHLLDWDKPFVKQSDAVRNALEGSSLFKSQSYTKPIDPELFGRTLYDDFVFELEDKKNVSDAH